MCRIGWTVPELSRNFHSELPTVFGKWGLSGVVLKRELEEVRTWALGYVPLAPFMFVLDQLHQELAQDALWSIAFNRSNTLQMHYVIAIRHKFGLDADSPNSRSSKSVTIVSLRWVHPKLSHLPRGRLGGTRKRFRVRVKPLHITVAQSQCIRLTPSFDCFIRKVWILIEQCGPFYFAADSSAYPELNWDRDL